MQKRYFVFLYIEDEYLQNLFDLAIYILNPEEKWQAHVTLAGPYTDPKRLPRNIKFEQKVSALGVGQFRSERQNTVFLRVGAQDLREFWDKPDFPYNPHLTLYDGSDAELADLLYENLLEVRMFLKFFTSRVHIVSSVKGQGSLELMSFVKFDLLPELKGIDIKSIQNFRSDEKIFYASCALKRAKNYSLST